MAPQSEDKGLKRLRKKYGVKTLSSQESTKKRTQKVASMVIPLLAVAGLVAGGINMYQNSLSNVSAKSSPSQSAPAAQPGAPSSPAVEPASAVAPAQPAAAEPAPQSSEDKYASLDAARAAKCAAVPTTHAPIDKQPSGQVALPSKAEAQQMLDGIPVGQREGYDTYCRDAFGEALKADFDQNGCSARQDALKRTAADLKTVPVKREYGTCEEVLSATWTDPYSGTPIHVDNMKSSDANKVQVDHMVPLYNAWISGADKWTPEQRAMFAADVSDWELLAVDGNQNQAKGNSSPDKWQPAVGKCEYAKEYTQVKSKYQLIVTDKEKAALQDMLNSCTV